MSFAWRLALNKRRYIMLVVNANAIAPYILNNHTPLPCVVVFQEDNPTQVLQLQSLQTLQNLRVQTNLITAFQARYKHMSKRFK